jgi:DNA polymerase delta subunit 1
MPEAIMPQKRVLGDATNKDRNGFASPNAMKKRKLDNESGGLKPPTQNGFRKGFGSTQPQKSVFEEEVLEKMTQDINDLKQSNAEKDQQWERPPLGPFNPATDNICFQQIDAEEGRMAGDRMAVRLFGVTEVISIFVPFVFQIMLYLTAAIGRSISFASCHRIPTLPLYRCPRRLHQGRLPTLQSLPRDQTGTKCPSHPTRGGHTAGEYLWFSG